MVRNSQPWKLGEPRLNEHGQPVAQHIAQILGCVPPNSNVDLQVQSAFPEDVTSMEKLYRELEEHESSEAASTPSHARDKELVCNRVDETAVSEPHDSDIKQGYCGTDFGTESAMNLPLQNLSTASDDLEFDGVASADMYGNALFLDTALSPFTWSNHNAQRSDLTMCFLQKVGAMQSIDILHQGLVGYEFNAMEPHILSDNSETGYRGTR
ncbi:hypothetical protein FOVSG1_006620 [Fusarium oxysporum f. sp. vasinfectum]